MPKYKFNARVIVSAYTTVEANSLEEAREELESREVAQMVSQSLYPDEDEAWHIDTDGEPENITFDGEED